MNTENKIPLLQEIIDEFENGTLDMTVYARKCYMSELERHHNRISWIHNNELRGHSLLRKMGQQNTKDLFKRR